MSRTICEQIQCPYFRVDPYQGCQRYQNSAACHLNAVYPGFDTRQECALYDRGELAVSLKKVSAKNQEILDRDPQYGAQMLLQEIDPELFAGSVFRLEPKRPEAVARELTRMLQAKCPGVLVRSVGSGLYEPIVSGEVYGKPKCAIEVLELLREK